MRSCVVALLMLAACTKDEGPKSTSVPRASTPPPAPAPAVSAPAPPPTTPRTALAPPFIVAAGARVVATDPLRWERDGHLWERGADPRKPIDLGERAAMKSAVFDADHWYVTACSAGCDQSHGQSHTLTRISRRDGTRKDLVTETYSGDNFNHLRVVGEHLVWCKFGAYGDEGEIHRMHRDGGAVEVLWKDTAARGYEILPGGMLAWSWTSVAWIADGKPAQVLASGLAQVNDATLHGDHVYIAEHGKPHHDEPPSGRVLRVPRSGGAPELLAGPVAWPQGVAADDHRVYIVLEDLPEVIVQPLPMGPLHNIKLPRPSGSQRCLHAFHMEQDPAGLYVQLGGYGSSCPHTIVFVPTT